MNNTNDYANDGITLAQGFRITRWGCGQDTLYFSIDGEEYSLCKRRGLEGSGGPAVVRNAFREEGKRGTEIIAGLRETAESKTFRHWRNDLLEQIDILEQMVAAE